ncbi:hypothetical protein G3N57_04160 [Paraburkholderia sp. Se-20369]|nr:hypothetical protein [Paraburkholderia sp. Se-20369]
MKFGSTHSAYRARPRLLRALRAMLATLAAASLTQGAWPAQALAAGVASPVSRAALQTPLALHAVMEAVAPAGDRRLVAVGERGIVLLSDDLGRHWRQAAAVPVSVTLTCVQFVDAQRGWAAGHAGVVLSTEDGGEHWTRKLDGVDAARVALQEATGLVPAQPSVVPVAPGSSPADVALNNARRLVKEGADKPFLSLWFTDAQHGTVVGAYGLAAHTDDGGRTWQSWSARIGDLRSLHLYSVRQRGDALWVAGEQGFVARSDDAGRRFTTVRTPYKGSFFALGIGADGTVMLGGLRGNTFRTTDGGASFSTIAPDGQITITDIVSAPDHTWLFANQAGQVFASRDAGGSFTPLVPHAGMPLNGIAVTNSGEVIGAGFGGVAPVAALTAGTNRTPPNMTATGAHDDSGVKR